MKKTAEFVWDSLMFAGTLGIVGAVGYFGYSTIFAHKPLLTVIHEMVKVITKVFPSLNKDPVGLTATVSALLGAGIGVLSDDITRRVKNMKNIPLCDRIGTFVGWTMYGMWVSFEAFTTSNILSGSVIAAVTIGAVLSYVANVTTATILSRFGEDVFGSRRKNKEGGSGVKPKEEPKPEEKKERPKQPEEDGSGDKGKDEKGDGSRGKPMLPGNGSNEVIPLDGGSDEPKAIVFEDGSEDEKGDGSRGKPMLPEDNWSSDGALVPLGKADTDNNALVPFDGEKKDGSIVPVNDGSNPQTEKRQESDNQRSFLSIASIVGIGYLIYKAIKKRGKNSGEEEV